MGDPVNPDFIIFVTLATTGREKAQLTSSSSSPAASDMRGEALVSWLPSTSLQLFCSVGSMKSRM
jgi:hypothetical protein